MKHTPDLYMTVFNLDELLQKALKESDSDGKRRTFQGIHGFFTRYLEAVDAYLRTPQPTLEQHVPYLATTERDLPWIQRDRYRLNRLRRELNEK